MSEPGVGPAGQGGRDVGGVGGLDHVLGIGFIGYAQSDAQVGVGSDIG